MGQEVHAQQSHEIGQTPVETGGPLQIAQQRHRDQCGPSLSRYGVGGGADARPDLQVRLQGFEEQLDLPTILVNGGDGTGVQPVVVDRKHQDFAGILPARFDMAQQMCPRLLCSHTGEPNGPILQDAATLRRRSLREHFELGVVLHARDKEHLGISPFGEQAIVVVAPIIPHDRASDEAHLASRSGIVHLPIGDEAKAMHIDIVAEHQMELDRGLCAAKLRSVVHRPIQINRGRVETDHLVLETERVFVLRLGVDRLEQPEEDLSEQLPWTVAVGVRQRGADSGGDPQVDQLAFAALQPASL